MPKDLRYFIGYLEDHSPKELRRIRKEVDPRYEITTVLRKLQDEGKYPAVIFESVNSSEMPVVSGLVGNNAKLMATLETSWESLLPIYMEREEARIGPRTLGHGPIKDVILKGNQVDLQRIPIVTQCEKDGGPFVTAGITVVKDPETGVRNCGIYRMMVQSRKELTINFEMHSHLGHIYRKTEAMGEPLEAITFIGHHPACILGSQSKLAFGVDEMEVMGGLMGEPLDIIKAETVNMEAPAFAEIVLEGRILPSERRSEGPFGEFTMYYGTEYSCPVFEVTAVTHRRDAMYQDLFSTHPEHHLVTRLGRESVLYKRVKAAVPSIKNVHLPLSGFCRFTAYVQIAKRYDGEGKLAALAALCSDPYVKFAVIVDDDVNIFDDAAILQAIATRTQIDRDTFFVPDAAGSRLDPSAYIPGNRMERGEVNTKWAIDATKPVGIPFPEIADIPRDVWERTHLEDYLGLERL